MTRIKHALAVAVCAGVLAACVQSPTGRNQLLLFSPNDMSQMGIAAFDKMKQEQKIHRGSKTNRYVSCVADSITAVLPGEYQAAWEVVVFEDDSANAFALPGGKIGVHTGILKVARNQDQLAAVIGHEIGHVIANHSAERMSMQFVSQSSQQLIGAMVDGSGNASMIMSALGLGAQYGVLMPWGRTQESESDVIGLDLMSRAGFDPNGAVELWHNMASQGGAQPPEFMSTHPSHQTRITGLQRAVPRYAPTYQQARASGRRPNCA